MRGRSSKYLAALSIVLLLAYPAGSHHGPTAGTAGGSGAGGSDSDIDNHAVVGTEQDGTNNTVQSLTNNDKEAPVFTEWTKDGTFTGPENHAAHSIKAWGEEGDNNNGKTKFSGLHIQRSELSEGETRGLVVDMSRAGWGDSLNEHITTGLGPTSSSDEGDVVLSRSIYRNYALVEVQGDADDGTAGQQGIAPATDDTITTSGS